jgi:hypothetical protein
VYDLDWHHILCNWICAWTWQVTRHFFCWNLVIFFWPYFFQVNSSWHLSGL